MLVAGRLVQKHELAVVEVHGPAGGHRGVDVREVGEVEGDTRARHKLLGSREAELVDSRFLPAALGAVGREEFPRS